MLRNSKVNESTSHLPGIVLSHEYLTGVHWKIVVKLRAIRLADYAELSLVKDIEVEEEERQFRYGDSVLDEALEYKKVQ